MVQVPELVAKFDGQMQRLQLRSLSQLAKEARMIMTVKMYQTVVCLIMILLFCDVWLGFACAYDVYIYI